VIRPIQYLRAFAALSVAWLHTVYGLPSAVQWLGAPYFGGSGVDLFFVISGFIMVVSAANKEPTPGRFFCLRLIRIVPLYWVATLAMLALAAWGYAERSSFTPAEIATSLLFVPYASYPHPALPIVENGWTLNYEMFFYLLFALWLAAPRNLRPAGLLLTLVALVVFGKLAGPFTSAAALAFTSPLLLEFAAGALLGHAWLRGLRLGLLASLLLILFGGYFLGATHPRAVILGGATLLVAGCLHPRICALENRLLLQLGNASYSIYLTHQFVVDAVAREWPRLVPHASFGSSALYLALTLLLCTAVAWLCYLIIEQPLTSRLRKLLLGAAAAVHGGPQPRREAA